MELMNICEVEQLRETYRKWIDAAIMKGNTTRQPQWTESIATGNKVYVEKVKNHMGYKAIVRKIVENRDSFVLREPQVSYQSISDRAIRVQPEDNTICWQNGPENNQSWEFPVGKSQNLNRALTKHCRCQDFLQ
jgi:hypothetical protein